MICILNSVKLKFKQRITNLQVIIIFKLMFSSIIKTVQYYLSKRKEQLA